MDVRRFFEAIAIIISAREGVTVQVVSIKKAAGNIGQTPAATPKGN